MSQDEFTKLFTYMQHEFTSLQRDIDGRFAKTDARFDQIMNVLDMLLKNQETHEQERLAMGKQLDRHERWIRRTAPRTGVEYNW